MDSVNDEDWPMAPTPIQEVDFRERGCIVDEAGDADSVRPFVAG